HVTVLPRADACDPRPYGRAPAALLARRADAEEPAPGVADARPAVVPEAARPHRPQPRRLRSRNEAERGGRCAGNEGALRVAVGPCSSAFGQPWQPRRAR